MERLKKEVEYYKRQVEELEVKKALKEDLANLSKGKSTLPEDINPIQEDDEEDDEEFANVLYQENIHKVTTEETPKPKPDPRLVKNILYNMNVEFEIPRTPRFGVQAILDTGATTCYIDEEAVPKEALEQNNFIVHLSSINSKQTASECSLGKESR